MLMRVERPRTEPSQTRDVNRAARLPTPIRLRFGARRDRPALAPVMLGGIFIGQTV